MKKPLLITTGEPAGIGMDIVLQLASKQKFALLQRKIIVLADYHAINERWLLLKNSLGNKLKIHQLNHHQTGNFVEKFTDIMQNYQENCLNILHLPVKESVIAGQLIDENAHMVLAQLQVAHNLAITKQVSAIVTAPLQKSVVMKIYPSFMGHTEFFMEKSGLDKVVMMLANSVMRVALVTTHLPLKAVADAITANEVRKTVEIILTDCEHKFGLKNPKILVCGLNPHAGENGYLGSEEIEIINPVLQSFQDKNVDISLALPADTLFTEKYLKNCDVVVAMYHDQGLAPLKSHGFGETVSITLGLPYIRTSVDHGTALDLAGTGLASSESLYHAILYADSMANTSDFR